MPSPTLIWYYNTGTEGTPTWSSTISTSQAFYFTGPDTTASVLDPVTAPSSGTKFPEEMWVADYPTFGTGTQVSLYEQAISTAVNTNVFAIQFNTNPTSTAPKLTSWDTTAHTTTAKELLNGTASTTGHSLLRGVITSSNVTPAAGAGTLPGTWGTQTTTTTTYQLQGDARFQTASASITAGNQIRFVLSCFVPSDIAAGTTGHDPVLTCKFTFT